mmetsp:Transcript_13017/g.18227  ORF Transcript_13017/g.18227 Transcript_13017/m.18227 type:complete len:509 (+) Transcript_13017:69-1595(+)
MARTSDAAQDIEQINPAVETDPLLGGAARTGAISPTSISDEYDEYYTDQNYTKLALEDAIDIFKLGVPLFISMVSWVGMRTTDTALLGHVSGEALSASALSDLWTMTTGPLIQGRVLGIFCGQAVGAGNPKLAGIWLQVSLYVLSMLSIVVFISWNVTEYVWIAFGEDEAIAKDAGYYARVLSFAIPGTLMLSQATQFFSSQQIMRPEVVASSVALVLNLVLGLFLVLGIPFPNFAGYGFAACPWVTSSVTYLQVLIVGVIFCYIQGLHRPCWGGWSWKEITNERVKSFSGLYFPSALSLASDFWRVAAIGGVAAKIGEEEVGVFNTSYRIMWITLILIGAIARAAGIKMSLRLGNGDPTGAKRAGYVGIFVSVIILFFLSGAVVWKIREFAMIFTDDDVFLNLFEEMRWPFVATLFFMNLSVAIEKVPISMGRTTAVFWAGFAGSWLGQVPGVIFFTVYWRNDLVGLYTGMAVGYILCTVLYSFITLTSDWKKYSDQAIERSEAKED